MDKKTEELVKRIIRDDIGQMISDELKTRFKPIETQIESIQGGQDLILKQLNEDRKDINQIKIDQAKNIKQNQVIIDNQDKHEEKVVEAVKEEAEKIPGKVEQGIEKMFKEKSFLKNLKDKFLKRGSK